jgi:hypothetical protein
VEPILARRGPLIGQDTSNGVDTALARSPEEHDNRGRVLR